MEKRISSASLPSHVAKKMQDCPRYRLLLLKKAEVDLELKRRKQTIQTLAADVETLALEVEKAKLEEKWGLKKPGEKLKPAEESLRLCQLLDQNPDELDAILRELCIHQSKVTSQVTDLKMQLKQLEKD
ncbi:hypothetical protein HOLleu_08136 [Holothuria leucospilota]|uniref:Uncharacterized protein n=1 Tax=Holothuria leucospilota TaxID=206669 RepID=A0A9Q1CHS2_HOLLE|nr:hypothetical protein HOLleu_08136 [Holothuria leucospilota]